MKVRERIKLGGVCDFHQKNQLLNCGVMEASIIQPKIPGCSCHATLTHYTSPVLKPAWKERAAMQFSATCFIRMGPWISSNAETEVSNT
jgi:hypothetical protein